jgi:SAM-dependent methyltransferase
MSIRGTIHATIFPIIGYRPQRVSAERWDREYRDGAWKYLGTLENLAGLAAVFGYCQFLRPATVLDVGCGEGLLAEKLKLLPYGSYLGIDISREAIAQAERLSDKRTQFMVADAGDFNPPGSFDAIIFNQSLYYLPDPARMVAHYGTMLSAQGRIIVSMYDGPRNSEAWPLIERVMKVEDAMDIRQGAGRVITKLLAPHAR